MVTVSNLVGNAWVRLESGELQPLEIGDRIPTDAEVITAPGATITLEADGLPPFVVGEDRELLLDPSLFEDEVDVDPSQFALPPLADAEAARFLAALDAGEDPFDELDPTAAILSSGGVMAEGGGFVRLIKALETTTPLALAYPKPTLEIVPMYYQPSADAVGAAAVDNRLDDEEGLVPPLPEEEIIDDGDGDSDADAHADSDSDPDSDPDSDSDSDSD